MHTKRIGIAGIEISLPTHRMTIDNMSAHLGEDVESLYKDIGIRQKPICNENEAIILYAIDAAKKLVKNSKLDPNQIDIIIHASCGITDKQLWSPAAKIQKEIQAKNAFAFDIQNGCNSGNLALQVASQFLQSDDTKSTALIIVADALSKIVDYSNPIHKCIFSFSDGASAILVTKESQQNKLLSFSSSTEATFADSIYLNVREQKIWMNDDEEEDKALINEYEMRYTKMIQSALQKVGKTINEVKYIVMNQGDHKLINKLTNKFSLSPTTIFRSHENYGHLGGTDIFFGLQKLIANNAVASGDLVVLASSAVGFSWGASVIQI